MKKTTGILSFIFITSISVFSNNIFEGTEETKSTNKSTNQYYLTFSESLEMNPSVAPQNVSYPGRGLLFVLVPNYSQFLNKELSGDVSGKFGFNIEIGYFMKPHRLIAVGAGLGYSYYNSSYSNDSYQEITSTDHDNQQVVKSIQTNQLIEELKIGYLDIPIYVEFGNPNVDKVGFYGRIGVKISFPINSSLSGEGTFTSWGYYPDCPVELHDIPELGYYTNEPLYNGQEEIKLNPVVFSAYFSGGISFNISSLMVLKVGINANLGLSEISELKADDNAGIEDVSTYSKILSNPSKTTLNSYGLEIGLIYSLNIF